MSDTTTTVRADAEKAAEKAGDAVATGAAAVEDSAGRAAAAAKDAAGSATDAAKKAASGAVTTVESKARAATPGGGDAGKPAKPPQRSVSEIEADLDATRARLAGRIDDLTDYVKPKNVLDRQVAKAKGVFVDEYGGIRPERVLIAAGVVVAVVVVLGLRGRRR